MLNKAHGFELAPADYSCQLVTGGLALAPVASRQHHARATTGTNPCLRPYGCMQGFETEFLKKAAEYRRLADSTDDNVIVACLIEIAEQYEELAQRLEQPQTSLSAPEGSRTW
jgi:hypothetical protein